MAEWPVKKYLERDYAVFHNYGSYFRPVGGFWIQPCFWPRPCSLIGRFKLAGLDRGWTKPVQRLFFYNTPPYLYGLSAYVRRNYGCSYSGSSRRADELFGIFDLHLPLVYFSLRSPGSLGLGSGRLASRKRLFRFRRQSCGPYKRRVFRTGRGSGSGKA